MSGSTIRVIPIGIGSAHAKKCHPEVGYLWNTNILIEYLEDGVWQRFLFDCGATAQFALNELNLEAWDISSYFVSHQHEDHIGGFGWAARECYFREVQKPVLYVPSDLRYRIWNESLAGGLKTLEVEAATLETYFEVRLFDPNQWIQLGEHRLTIIKVIHHYEGGQLQPCYGFILELADGFTLLYTCDTRFVPKAIWKFYKRADRIVHDCETSVQPTGIHAHIDDLITLPAEIKERMLLGHFNDNYRDYEPEAHGFMGYLEKGRDILANYHRKAS